MYMYVALRVHAYIDVCHLQELERSVTYAAASDSVLYERNGMRIFGLHPARITVYILQRYFGLKTYMVAQNRTHGIWLPIL